MGTVQQETLDLSLETGGLIIGANLTTDARELHTSLGCSAASAGLILGVGSGVGGSQVFRHYPCCAPGITLLETLLTFTSI